MDNQTVDNPVTTTPAPAPEQPVAEELPATAAATPVSEKVPIEDGLSNEKTPAGEETVPAEKEEAVAPATEEKEQKEEEMIEEDVEEELLNEDDEEWVSDEEPVKPQKRGRKSSRRDDDDDDEDFDGPRKRRVVVPKKPVLSKSALQNEPAGLKALRQYTSALRLGPRCFRNLNTIMNVKEREDLLISRLHDCGRQWAGEYPTAAEIEQAKEETRAKKAEKTKEFIIDDSLTGGRSSRKAAEKARAFVKTLGEGEMEEGEDEEVNDEDLEAEVDLEEEKDEE